jgi:hypothetical protein
VLHPSGSQQDEVVAMHDLPLVGCAEFPAELLAGPAQECRDLPGVEVHQSAGDHGAVGSGQFDRVTGPETADSGWLFIANLTVNAESQELVHAIYTYPFLPKDPGLLVIGASLQEERWQDALTGILAEVERMQRDGVTAAELERAKRNLEGEFIYQRETVQGQASQLGYFGAILGNLTYESRYLKAIARTTPQDIQRVARTRAGRATFRFRANEAGADDVERAGLRGEDRRAVELADHQRTDAERVAGADQLLVGERHERISAFELAQALDEPVDEAVLEHGRGQG